MRWRMFLPHLFDGVFAAIPEFGKPLKVPERGPLRNGGLAAARAARPAARTAPQPHCKRDVGRVLVEFRSDAVEMRCADEISANERRELLVADRRDGVRPAMLQHASPFIVGVLRDHSHGDHHAKSRGSLGIAAGGGARELADDHRDVRTAREPMLNIDEIALNTTPRRTRAVACFASREVRRKQSIECCHVILGHEVAVHQLLSRYIE
jgi:hypothetical protein